MRDHYDFSNGRKNPYAEKLRKEGFTVIIHYGPDDLSEIDGAEECNLLPDEIAAFEEYRARMEAEKKSGDDSLTIEKHA
jgi:hypothetical protein